jgi:hypothetical protein
VAVGDDFKRDAMEPGDLKNVKFSPQRFYELFCAVSPSTWLPANIFFYKRK